MRKINMSPEAMAALQSAEGGVIKPTAPPLKLPRVSLLRLRNNMLHTLFGEAMQPTFRARLLMYSSFAAILATWRADNFLRRATARKIIEGLNP